MKMSITLKALSYTRRCEQNLSHALQISAPKAFIVYPRSETIKYEKRA